MFIVGEYANDLCNGYALYLSYGEYEKKNTYPSLMEGIWKDEDEDKEMDVSLI